MVNIEAPGLSHHTLQSILPCYMMDYSANLDLNNYMQSLMDLFTHRSSLHPALYGHFYSFLYKCDKHEEPL